jgi:hypothetical protein
MNASKKLLLGISATIALGVASAPVSTTYAQAPSCRDVVFTSEITNRFPNARDACLGVVEKSGEQYAKFTAEIDRVSGSRVDLKFLLPDGSYSRVFSFNPPPDARVRIQNRSYRYRDLNRGQQINIYVPPNRWMFATYTDETADFEEPAVVSVSTVPVSPAPTSSSMSSLPSTASPLPLIGLLGGMFMLLGAGLTAVRRRG